MTIKGQQQLTSSEVPNSANRYPRDFVDPVTTSSQLSHNRSILASLAALALLSVATGAAIAAFLNANAMNYWSVVWSVALAFAAGLGACFLLQGQQQ
jgi:hypothetical protein